MYKKNNEIANWITDAIISFSATSPENSLQNSTGEKAWDEPLVGFSQGNDPLYQQIQNHIGDFYWTPTDVFNLSFPGPQLNPDQLSVICWILPQTQATKQDNRKQNKYPAERWVRSRLYGRKFNRALLRYVVDILTKKGYQAAAPVLMDNWQRFEHEKHGYASNWSERHTAFVSGLGTFGLCDGLITPKGKAVRIGSVVTDAPLPPTQRPYTRHQEYCLFYKDSSCIACANRCPSGAITENGHDKIKCRKYVRKIAKEYEKIYHLDQRACGLCQTNIPCESKIPF